MWVLISGLVLFFVPGAWALGRANRELHRRGGISLGTFIALFVAYAGHAAITVVAAWRGTWPLPLPNNVAFLAGATLVVVGAVVYVAGRLQFNSFRLTWGLDSSRLVTTGIYRFTRNPQTIGSLLLLSGVGLLGRSGVALLLVAAPWLASLIWLPIEERFLQHRFGVKYNRYRDGVPRYVGWPRRRGQGGSVAA